MSRWAGIFGKVPETGDFVAHGLPPGTRIVLDRWLTARLAGTTTADGWPTGGVRALIDAPSGFILLVAVPSHDRARRRFPLAAATDGANVGFEDAESWCDAVTPYLEASANGKLRFTELAVAVADAAPPILGAPNGEPAVWRRGGPPFALGAEDESVLDLFNSD